MKAKDLICAFSGDGRNGPCESVANGSLGLCRRCYQRMCKDDRIVPYREAWQRRKAELKAEREANQKPKRRYNFLPPKEVVDRGIIEIVEQSEVAISVRYLYYRLTDAGIMPRDANLDSKDTPSYTKIVKRCLHLRQTGRVSWDAILDETRSESAFDHADNRDVSPQDVVFDRLENLTGYNLCAWERKDVVCELWVESRSFAATIYPTCQKFSVDLVPMGGQISWSNVYVQMKRIYARGKATDVLCLTDYDYAGGLIAKCHREAVEFFDSDSLVTFRQIGLTAEQVDAYGLSTLEPGNKQRKFAPHMTFACDLEAMEIEDMEQFVSGYFREYITEGDIADAREEEQRLRDKENDLGKRIIELVRGRI